MTMRLSSGTTSFGVVVLTATMIACANGGVADSGGDNGTDTDSGAVVGDEAGNTTGDDSGGYTTYDSGEMTPDSGGTQNDAAAMGDSASSKDSASSPDSAPPADASAPDSAPPQDASPPDSAPPDSGVVCNKPSGNPCVLTAPQCGCAANEKCDINPSNANVDVCVATSASGTQGSLCTKYPDCSAGFACIQYDAFGDTECEAWCVIGGPNICTGGTTCKALGTTITLGGQNYGTCQ